MEYQNEISKSGKVWPFGHALQFRAHLYHQGNYPLQGCQDGVGQRSAGTCYRDEIAWKGGSGNRSHGKHSSIGV